MSASPAPHARAAFAFRDFRLLQIARFIAVIGTQMQTVAVGWIVFDITGSALQLGYVGLAQFLPAFALSMVTGTVADRLDRRKILLAYYASMVVAALALYAIARSGTHDTWWIYAVLVFIGVARAFAGPAGQALLPEIVPPEVFRNAVAWNSSTWQLATIVGPAFGGGLYAIVRRADVVYLGVAVLLAAATVCTAMMHVRTGRREKKAISLETLFAGVRYIRSKPVILGSISLDLFAVLLGGAVALMPAFAKDVLHVGPLGFGILRSAPAVGAGGMAIWLANNPIKADAGKKMFAAVAVFGLATIVFGLSKIFVLSLAALVVVGASDMISVVVRQTLVQLTTPNEMRGRVSAVNLVFIGASNELGEFESGVTAEWMGTVPSVIVGGIGTLLVVAIWAGLFPALRKVDRLE